MVSRPRSQEPARPYRELVASPVYFSNEKWSECLASHGLIVDAENRTLTVQSENVNADMVYDLTEEEIKTLTSNSLEEHSIEQRLELLNGVIAGDFADKVTLDDLNSDKHIAIGLHPEVHEELAARHYQEYAQANGQTEDYGNSLQLSDEIGGHGTEISQIAVEPGPEEGKYRMTARHRPGRPTATRLPRRNTTSFSPRTTTIGRNFSRRSSARQTCAPVRKQAKDWA